MPAARGSGLDFERRYFRFLHGGVDLAHAEDAIPEGKFARATNIRSYEDGTIEARPGYSGIASVAAGSIHSLRRLEDPTQNSFMRVAGSGTALYAGGSGALSQVATGLSGSPWTAVEIAPFASMRPYLYIADRAKLLKISVGDAAASNWGIETPKLPPNLQFAPAAFRIIEDFESTTGWTAGGTASGLTAAARVSTTISAIAYDEGTSGWCSIAPASTTQFNEGMLVTIGGSETTVVWKVLPAISSTTAAAISYESGTSGLASVQLQSVPRHLVPGSLVQIGSEVTVVREVVPGPNGIPAIRVRLSAGHAAGETVTGFAAFRAYTSGSFSAGATLASNYLGASIAKGIGTLSKNISVDASTAGGRPIDTERDIFHISIWVSDLTLIDNIQVYLNVDPSDTTFSQNYYFKVINPSDFAFVVKDKKAILDQRIQRLQRKLLRAIQAGNFERQEQLRARLERLSAKLDRLEDIPTEALTTIGDNQWSEIKVRLAELSRAGTEARSLRDITGIRIKVNALDAVTVRVDACWVGGTYGPDVGTDGQPYRYMVRFRSTATGARSGWGPGNLGGISPERQGVVVSLPVSSDPQVDVVDVARIGGNIPGWKLVGSGPPGGTFTDTISDLDAINLPDIVADDLGSFRPFVVAQTKKSGTVNVAGYILDLAAGDSFDARWVRGTPIRVGDKYFRIAGVVSSTKLLLDASAGSGSASYLIDAPEAEGVPLESVFGPIGYGETGLFVFGAGSRDNPGTLFWTNGNDPDLARGINYLEVSSPCFNPS